MALFSVEMRNLTEHYVQSVQNSVEHLKRDNILEQIEADELINDNEERTKPEVEGQSPAASRSAARKHLFSTRILGGLRVFSPEFARRKNGRILLPLWSSSWQQISEIC